MVDGIGSTGSNETECNVFGILSSFTSLLSSGPAAGRLCLLDLLSRIKFPIASVRSG